MRANRRGGSPDCRRGRGQPARREGLRSAPLHWAGRWERGKEAAALLLEKGADPKAKDDDSATPLHNAAARSNPEVVGLLLARGSAPSALDGKSRTPLHCAAAHCVYESYREPFIACAKLLFSTLCGRRTRTSSPFSERGPSVFPVGSPHILWLAATALPVASTPLGGPSRPGPPNPLQGSPPPPSPTCFATCGVSGPFDHPERPRRSARASAGSGAAPGAGFHRRRLPSTRHGRPTCLRPTPRVETGESRPTRGWHLSPRPRGRFEREPTTWTACGMTAA